MNKRHKIEFKTGYYNSRSIQNKIKHVENIIQNVNKFDERFLKLKFPLTTKFRITNKEVDRKKNRVILTVDILEDAIDRVAIPISRKLNVFEKKQISSIARPPVKEPKKEEKEEIKTK